MNVFPGPHPRPPLDVLLQDGGDGVPPPAPPVLPQGAGRAVFQEPLVDGHAVQGLQQAHDVLVLEFVGVRDQDSDHTHISSQN